MKQSGNLEQCLRELGYAVAPTWGSSMWPLLRQGKSWVQLVARDGRQPRLGDVVLYRRADGGWILHRIIRVEEGGVYLLCGDHQWNSREYVREEQILAIATAFSRNGHEFDDRTWWYRLYRRVWNGNLTVRRCCLAALRLSGLDKPEPGSTL